MRGKSNVQRHKNLHYAPMPRGGQPCGGRIILGTSILELTKQRRRRALMGFAVRLF
jgi:hypothetical protein